MRGNNYDNKAEINTLCKKMFVQRAEDSVHMLREETNKGHGVVDGCRSFGPTGITILLVSCAFSREPETCITAGCCNKPVLLDV